MVLFSEQKQVSVDEKLTKKSEITVFWNVTDSYHFPSPLKVKAVGFAEVLVPTYQPKRHSSQQNMIKVFLLLISL
jgi:hypothetical protein